MSEKALSRDWQDSPIKYLILEEKDTFIVYIDEEGDVYWEIGESYEGPEDTEQHNAIISDAAALEATPCEELGARVRQDFKRLLGEAIARSFENDYVNGRRTLASAREFIMARGEEQARFWHLTATAGMAIPVMLAGLVLWLLRGHVLASLGSIAFWVLMAGAAGAAGALLSVITRTGDLRVDFSAGRWLIYLEGTSRIWAGSLSGSLVGFAVQADLVLGAWSRGDKLPVITVIGGFVGGMGERLATSIVSSIESSAAKPRDADLVREPETVASEDSPEPKRRRRKRAAKREAGSGNSAA